MIPLLLWFVVGAVVGTVAMLLARGDEAQGLFGNIVAGIAAALLAGGWLAPRIGWSVGRPLPFVLGALGLSLFGAVAAAWVVQFVRERPAA